MKIATLFLLLVSFHVFSAEEPAAEDWKEYLDTGSGAVADYYGGGVVIVEGNATIDKDVAEARAKGGLMDSAFAGGTYVLKLTHPDGNVCYALTSQYSMQSTESMPQMIGLGCVKP